MLSASPGDAAPPFEHLDIVAPAPKGGGWDHTARAMQSALVQNGLAMKVDVVNSPGAGGVIGLAEFVNAHRGHGTGLLVGGMVMVSAIQANRSTVSLAQTTPIARLTGSFEVIAVPAESSIPDLHDLVRRVRADPPSVAFGGGSAGGTEQLLLYALARALDVEPVVVRYVPFVGGDEVAAALLNNRIRVGIAEYDELASYLERGELRALAVSGDARLPGIAVPTLKEHGIDLSFVNWRGVFAPPGLNDDQRERLQAAIAAMRATATWQEALKEHGWVDLYLPGDEFVGFLLDEEARGMQAPDPRRLGPPLPPRALSSGMWLQRNRARLGVGLGLISVALVFLVTSQRVRAARRERELTRRLEEAEASYRQRSSETQELLRGLTEQIDRQFEKWELSNAEREIAWLMLKGLRHKEIAQLRGRSERTVRTQALGLYKKAGLDGRTDLAAFFLEHLLHPGQPAGKRTA